MSIQMLSSFSASSYAVRSSPTMCGLSALSASGRLSVIVALCPSTSYLMYFMWSPSTELRCALVAECRQPLFEIGCPARKFHVEELLSHRLSQRGVLGVVEALLRQPDRDRRSRRQPGHQVRGYLVEVGCAHATVNQSPVRGVASAHLLAEQ